MLEVSTIGLDLAKLVFQLLIGASSVVNHASRRGAPQGSWLARMLAAKPRMLVIVALANKMARIIWAMTVHDQDYRAPATA